MSWIQTHNFSGVIPTTIRSPPPIKEPPWITCLSAGEADNSDLTIICSIDYHL
jgi:hypothetical protein